MLEKITTLEKENKSLKSSNKPPISKSKEKLKQNEDGGQLQINIDSLKGTKHGWDIMKDTLKIEKNSSYLVFGILGSKLAGKSHLLARLMKNNNDLEYNATKGISFVEYNQYKTIAVDCEGLNAGTEYYSESIIRRFSLKDANKDLTSNNEIRTQVMNDRILTDVFLSEFISEISKILIIVVDILCLSDQKLIERVNVPKDPNKRILIVHNFKHIKTRDQIKKFIKTDILNSFNVSKSLIPNSEVPFYIEKRKNMENVIHYIMACENSEAGDFYNNQTINHIQKTVEICMERRKFDIYSELSDFFQENFRRYFMFQTKPQNPLRLTKKDNKIFIQIDGNFMVSNPVYNAYLPKTENEPKYQLIETKKNFQATIEISDLDTKTLEIYVDKKANFCNMLVVKGEKKEGRLNEGDIVYGNIKSGEFLYEIPIGNRTMELEKEIFKEYKKGVLIIVVEKKQDHEEKIDY